MHVCCSCTFCLYYFLSVFPPSLGLVPFWAFAIITLFYGARSLLRRAWGGTSENYLEKYLPRNRTRGLTQTLRNLMIILSEECLPSSFQQLMHKLSTVPSGLAVSSSGLTSTPPESIPLHGGRVGDDGNACQHNFPFSFLSPDITSH